MSWLCERWRWFWNWLAIMGPPLAASSANATWPASLEPWAVHEPRRRRGCFFGRRSDTRGREIVRGEARGERGRPTANSAALGIIVCSVLQAVWQGGEGWHHSNDQSGAMGCGSPSPSSGEVDGRGARGTGRGEEEAEAVQRYRSSGSHVTEAAQKDQISRRVACPCSYTRPDVIIPMRACTDRMADAMLGRCHVRAWQGGALTN